MARALKARTAQLIKDFKGAKIARYDKWDFSALPPANAADSELFSSLAEALNKKTGGIDLGFGWNVKEALKLDRAEMLDAMRELEPLYRIVRAV
ncbi:MAG: hypothetical protein ABSG46_12755 [Candidatus Binataceae bacterium]